MEQSDDGENDVARQNGKVHRAHRAVASGKIARREARGSRCSSRERPPRTQKPTACSALMRLPVAVLDEIQAHAERSRMPFRTCIEGRKTSSASEIGRSTMDVQQPQQEVDNRARHHNDRSNHRSADPQCWAA